MRILIALYFFLIAIAVISPSEQARAESPDELQKLANSGDADAQFRLAQWYFWAIPTARDFKQAVYWYCRAAERGHRDSQIQLGVMYWQGTGVPRDFVQAYLWFDLASKTVAGIAEEYRERIAKQYLSNADVALAKAMAEAWVKTPRCPVQLS